MDPNQKFLAICAKPYTTACYSDVIGWKLSSRRLCGDFRFVDHLFRSYGQIDPNWVHLAFVPNLLIVPNTKYAILNTKNTIPNTKYTILNAR